MGQEFIKRHGAGATTAAVLEEQQRPRIGSRQQSLELRDVLKDVQKNIVFLSEQTQADREQTSALCPPPRRADLAECSPRLV